MTVNPTDVQDFHSMTHKVLSTHTVKNEPQNDAYFLQYDVCKIPIFTCGFKGHQATYL